MLEVLFPLPCIPGQSNLIAVNTHKVKRKTTLVGMEKEPRWRSRRQEGMLAGWWETPHQHCDCTCKVNGTGWFHHLKELALTLFGLFVCVGAVCVSVCVRAWEKKQQRQKERDKERMCLCLFVSVSLRACLIRAGSQACFSALQQLNYKTCCNPSCSLINHTAPH